MLRVYKAAGPSLVRMTAPKHDRGGFWPTIEGLTTSVTQIQCTELRSLILENFHHHSTVQNVLQQKLVKGVYTNDSNSPKPLLGISIPAYYDVQLLAYIPERIWSDASMRLILVE